MKYSEFSIESLKERLLQKAFKSTTPKKYDGDMFESYEIIKLLQAKIKRLEEDKDET